MISIITPTLNAADYLPDMLVSLYGQKGPFEHIVVDGGSTDQTCQLAKNAGSRVISAPGTNQSEALNIGFAQAKGDIWAWQNADDVYLPNCFSRVRRLFAETHSDVVYGGYQQIDAQGKVLCKNLSTPWAPWKLKYGRFVPMQPSTFWRAEVHQPLNPALHYTMDVDMFTRMQLAGVKFTHTPHLLGAFRYHPNSKTSDWQTKHRVLREHAKVLATNYNYNLYDSSMFWVFAMRSLVSGWINRRFPRGCK